jgi:hypothetical protein
MARDDGSQDGVLSRRTPFVTLVAIALLPRTVIRTTRDPFVPTEEALRWPRLRVPRRALQPASVARAHPK